MQNGTLSGRVAIVTGGASGIGRAVCERFVRDGAKVIVADLDGAKCESVASEIGNGAIGIALDVTSQTSIDNAVDFAIRSAGHIDILVNAAGIYDAQSILEITRDHAEKIFKVNMEGVIFMTQAVAKHMVARGQGGRIINFSSQAGRRGEAFAVAYCAAKAAVISITQSCALELIKHGINVNAIAPGVVDTPMWESVDEMLGKREGLAKGEMKKRVAAEVPAGRFGYPEEQAAMAAFLAGPDAAYIVAQCYNVDGGNVMS